ncbi:MAG: UbiA prenyltransferase family protein [Lachnospiraceae bacterium]|jgi:decaprenyl-phosphate phosphoribosyltransferase|nr:UbiA prenyltransferase family protein [Lachnospiraceae bacterium]MCI6330962.1 UbiA prenyltransferase family protein [Lachnospiraceae bacterium]MCI6409994.1 UbiA prenyltransferase family protein [Lachnospiraceae bacterium]MCI6978410.1 UbiA prenyltransferase family protein [Lachnospiraceae bacterium]MDD6580478.1 UbiA prenyltransferase family protein [Lachnospiraceae bacterium]
MKKYIKIARPDHWVKNAFILPGIVIAFLLTDYSISVSQFVMRFICGFIATCFIASANYVINEWLDAEFDKFHPTKKYRPVVSENMKFSLVMLEYAICIVLGVGFSLLVNIPFLVVELILLFMGVVYNVKPLRTKDIVYLDVISESVNNMLRLLLGWFIVSDSLIPPSSILIGYWFAGAFLMATKRFAEYRMIGDPEKAGLYRKSFKYYTEVKLLVSSFFYAMCATFFIGVFMIKYRMQYILGMPLIFGLFCFYLAIAFKPDSAAQKPEKLYKEKSLLIYLLILVVVLIALTFIDIPMPDYWLNPTLFSV